ncbi:MAG: hypothetical protein JW764_03360 [Chlorobiaceae bacterium]|nr:hypothetical protein [Chlorobiaceae bacterium]
MLRELFYLLFSSSSNPISSLFKRADLWYISGKEKETGEVVNIFFVGKEELKNYISELVYKEICGEICKRDKDQLSILYFLYKYRMSVNLLFKTARGSCFRTSDPKNHFSIPVWVSTTTALPLDKLSESVKSDLRKIRKNRLAYRVTISIDEVKTFYYDMLVPYMQVRHDKKILPVKLSAIIEKVEKGECELLLVKSGEQAVGGVLIIREKGGRAVLWRNGLIGGDLDYWKTGVIAATYYFSLEYLQGLGYDAVDFGYSRAFINDGVLNYKKKWGVSIKSKYRNHLLLIPVSLTDGAFGFFRSNPFIYHEKNDSLAVACFSGQDAKEKIRLYDGLSETVCFAKKENELVRIQE